VKRTIGDLVPPLLAGLLVGIAVVLTFLPLVLVLAEAMGAPVHRP
jgi:Na+-transporting methylmalonyl-CoA/oxaloacetate decarboxylase gamma subunit